MSETHYDTLGLKRQCSDAEIRGAYRKLVLRYHPDRSSDPKSAQIFIKVTQAFEVLSDSSLRRKYDFELDSEVRKANERVESERRARANEEARKRQTQAKRPSSPQTTVSDRSVTTVAGKLTRLSLLFSRQQFADCEKLAKEILRSDSRQPLPYAILGDISRARGHYDDAARLYSYALQMDPKNPVYLRRYEEILDRSDLTTQGRRVTIQPEEKRTFAVMTISGIGLLACLYIVLAPEHPIFSAISAVSSWTLGLVVMLFLSGVSAGAALGVGNLIDRVDAYSGGRIAPALSLGLIALVSFPAASLLYLIIGATQRAYNLTTTRIMLTVGALTSFICIAAATTGTIQPEQVALWGGNLVYLGSLCGWTVADSFRR